LVQLLKGTGFYEKKEFIHLILFKPIEQVGLKWELFMNIRSLLLTAIAAFVPLTPSAQTVYESTNEQGVVEFSDQPSSGSSKVTVQPNVVETAPVPKIDTYKRPEKKQAAAKPKPAASAINETTTVINNNPIRRNDTPGNVRPVPPVATPLPSPGPGAPTIRPAPAVKRN